MKTSWRTKILGMSSIILMGAGTTVLIHEKGMEVPELLSDSVTESTERIREGIESVADVVTDII